MTLRRLRLLVIKRRRVLSLCDGVEIVPSTEVDLGLDLGLGVEAITESGVVLARRVPAVVRQVSMLQIAPLGNPIREVDPGAGVSDVRWPSQRIQLMIHLQRLRRHPQALMA